MCIDDKHTWAIDDIELEGDVFITKAHCTICNHKEIIKTKSAKLTMLAEKIAD